MESLHVLVEPVPVAATVLVSEKKIGLVVPSIADENSNGKMDTNSMGIPREGVGASNNAKGNFGPPKFDAAAFQYSAGRIDLKITVNYF